ncbi:MAG TPA: cytochrome c family protein [Fimbriimonadaceae bacterium]|jgi:hypothetical protein
MKLWSLPLIALGGYGLFAPPAQPPRKDVLVIYGNVAGYLSPCGCTYPMSGGIQRFGSFVRELKGNGHNSITLVMPGGNVVGTGEQNEFKAECVAETAGAFNAAALGYSLEDAELGLGPALEMSQLSKDILLCSSVAQHGQYHLNAQSSTEAFLISSVSSRASSLARELGGIAVQPRLAINPFPSGMNGKSLIVSFDGDQTQAEEFARTYPEVGVLIYRSTSDPPVAPEQIGNTFLVTPGFHGKNVVTLTFEDGKFDGYNATLLGPDFKNDPDISAIYSDYLHRVDAAHLLQKLPKLKTAAYAGSQSCRGCHEKAYETWSQSGHAHAYRDLSAQGHGQDPDCVSCHVVGLSSKFGFNSVAHTPQFASVGCENCHGPGVSHNLHPKTVRMPRVNPSTCVSCHTIENSPGFDYSTFWPKVAH